LQDRVSQRHFLIVLITLCLVRGVLYAVLIPLWQAPDEPSHFEYVALIVEQGRLPDENSVSPRLRRAIVAAMPEQNYSRFMNPKIDGGDVLNGSVPDIPGPSELGHPPLYYLLGAVLLWPLRHQEISLQLYVLRFYSVLLSTLTLGTVYAAAHELFPWRWRLQAAMPLLLLFIPAHTFLSGTVNNDHLAELILSLQFFLWIRVLRRGLTWQRGLGIAALLGLGLWTKGTAAIGIPLACVALVIHVTPHLSLLFSRLPWSRVVVPVSTAGLLIVAGALVIASKNVQGWNKTEIWNSQDDTHAHKGQHSIHVESIDGQVNASVYQDMLPSTSQSLTGKRLILRAWVLAEEGEQAGFLEISDSRQTRQTKFVASPEWTLYVVESVIATDSQRVQVRLGVLGPEGVLYFDDVQLAEDRASPVSVTEESQNLLLNGSGEASQWDIKPSAYHFMTDVLRLNVAPQFFGSLLDWQRSVALREQYWTEFWVLLTNFWASMGVRQVNPSSLWQWALASLGLISAVGVILWIRREYRGTGDMEAWQKRILAFFTIAAGLAIVIPFARMHPLPTSYYPHGRYIYVGIVPIVMLLVFGWREWAVIRFKITHKTWLLSAGMTVGCLFDAMMLFDYAIPYFYGPT